MNSTSISRRSLLALLGTLPLALRARAANSVPVGLELYSVRNELKKDAAATVRAVAQMGYACVEFFAPYFDWTEAQAKDMRKLLDDLGVRCFSTHNSSTHISPENIGRARELNLILGARYVMLASAKPKPGPDGWLGVAEALNFAADQLQPAGLKTGYHNHRVEFLPVEGRRPMEILAEKTKPSVALQLDVGTCLEAGADPVAWIRAHPGRIRSIHCKDWSPDPSKGYAVLFGEGAADWKNIFQAAETVGGVEYYLIEQEGSRFSELETAQKCLASFRKMRPA
jgi:sugar phosphate isomerase/epimerase